MISFRPILHVLMQAIGSCSPEMEAAAAERWVIAEAETRRVQAAKFLPGQLDRIQGVQFGSVEEVVRDFKGGFDWVSGETRGFRLKDVDLVDGVLYAPGAVKHLRPREHKRPAYAVPEIHVSGALYESWVGNTWFGNWLSDDCLTYRLAEEHGLPVTTRRVTNGHVPDYEARLGIQPVRVGHVHFDELILFNDGANNTHKKARADTLRERLVSKVDREPHAGVFLLRGGTGAHRILLNERDIAEKLAVKHGFRVVDPSHSPVDEIVKACAGARVVMGVEGSQLVHGLMVMPPDATLFVIQPPDRTVSVLKMITDRQGQGYAFVIGSGASDGFTASWDEIDRTLDLPEA